MLEPPRDLTLSDTRCVVNAHSAFDAARALIDDGATVNCKGPDTPPLFRLSTSWEKSAVDAVKFLVDAGADVDNGGGSVCAMAPLHRACENGNETMVRALIEAGANIEKTTTLGETPLMYAAKRHSVRAVEVLLERGAAKDTKDRDGKSARDHARSRGPHAEIEELLT